MATQGIESICAAREATHLERCRNQAECNMENIRDISRRVIVLLERLGGPIPGENAKVGAPAESSGMLRDHLNDLELEGQRLGALQADLSMLERLL